MRKLFIFGSLLMFAPVLKAASLDALIPFRSSWTATNDTLVEVSTYAAGGILHSVVIGSATPGGFINLYDSKGGATSTIAMLSMDATKTIPFDIRISSGLTYSTTGNGAKGVTIIYWISKPVP